MRGGAELIFEVTRFFSELATYDQRDGRFHSCGVMGPDEYHDGYPDAPGEGLRRATFELRYRDQGVKVTMDQNSLHLATQPTSVQPIHVNLDGTPALLGSGQSLQLPIRARRERGGAR